MWFEKHVDRLIIFVCLLSSFLSVGLLGCANGRPPVKTLDQWEAERSRVLSTGGN
jgi:hypothetical protein